jgi:alpha-amylase
MKKAITLSFEVHQPVRIRKNFFWDNRIFGKVSKECLKNFYFDEPQNRRFILEIGSKCYYPANRIILEQIDRFKRDSWKFKVAYSLSGLFLEQCEMYDRGLLDSFQQLASTGYVEFLSQTYYHSLISLAEDWDEFGEQIRMHRDIITEYLKVPKPQIFENTELIYNNEISRKVEEIGFKAIFAEGADRVLGWRSPNFVYHSHGTKSLKVLLRNYRLTDDIGFRFSSPRWSEYPLTADKYAYWLSATPGDCINIFADYETFGEHHWKESGIFEFLRYLPEKVMSHQQLAFMTPSEVLANYPTVGVLDVRRESTTSWAGTERDLSSWLSNTMQWAAYEALLRVEPLVKESNDENFARIWRYLLTSDHFIHMYDVPGETGEVQSHFSPFKSASQAFVDFFAIVLDFKKRVQDYDVAAIDPFRFYTSLGDEGFTHKVAHSLRGFKEIVKIVPPESISFHNERGDFEGWALYSLHDEVLAKAFRRLRDGKESDPTSLAQGLSKAAESRLEQYPKRVAKKKIEQK